MPIGYSRKCCALTSCWPHITRQKPSSKFTSFPQRSHRGVQAPLDTDFAALREQYPDVTWHLITNERCHLEIVQQTLEKAESVADTSELFVRSSKLLNLFGHPDHNAAVFNITPSSLPQPDRLQPAPSFP